MTQFTEDKKIGGLQKARPTIEDITGRFNQHANNEYEAREEAERAVLERQATREQVQRDSVRLGGLKAYNRFTLESYDNRKAIKMCAGFPKRSLYLWGAAGTGKTHLATALVRDYFEARVVKPQHVYRACRGLKDGAEEQAAIDGFIHMPYLVLDDIGQEKRTEWSFSTLYEIIEGRDMWEMGGMIITSNFSLADLAARMDSDHIISRVNGLCDVVEIAGKDRRMTK